MLLYHRTKPKVIYKQIKLIFFLSERSFISLLKTKAFDSLIIAVVLSVEAVGLRLEEEWIGSPRRSLTARFGPRPVELGVRPGR